MLKDTKARRPKHRRDPAFLKALGQHCKRLRIQRGYSIDRLSKESDGLSPSVIHRLENGSGAVTVSALYRYASALDINIRRLFEFEFVTELPEGASPPRSRTTKHEVISNDDPRVAAQRFKTLLPVYSLKAAAGYFGQGHAVEPEGWVRVKGAKKLDERMFVARAVGESMLPKIRSGDWLVFRARPEGTRQGKIVLAQYRGPADPESGGSFTLKVYQSSKILDRAGGWRHRQITLCPLNPEYEPIVVHPDSEGEVEVVAEYLFTLE